MSPSITASILYDLVQCPHRVYMDHFEDPAKRDPTNPFVELLWEWGSAFEKGVIENLSIPFENLFNLSGPEKEQQTLSAMKRGDHLIYSGRIRAGDLLGEPDLLRRTENGYVAGDIKSGAGDEGADDNSVGKPKKHYAVQLALYTDILEKKGFSYARKPFIWDIHGQEIVYDLNRQIGPRNRNTLWYYYRSCLETADGILRQNEQTRPALSSICKLCHWRSACIRRIEKLDDLTMIPELGRSRRDRMMHHIMTVKAFADTDANCFLKGKKSIIRGVGAETLLKFHERAKLLSTPNAKPYLKKSLHLPEADREIFFDIETDPMRDMCYLHGFLERRGKKNKTERYIPFFALEPTAQEEQRVFARSWEFLRSSRNRVIYYYSPYERTIWRKLQQKYPDVMTETDMEDLFSPESAVDLYKDVVRVKTEWPTRDYSIKTLASYLGFQWRDTNPSGAASIEWYHRWVEGADSSVQQRILDYNEDDCRATRVLLDAIRELDVKGGPA